MNEQTHTTGIVDKDRPRWAESTNAWGHDGEGQDFFHYGEAHSTDADGGTAVVQAQRNEYRKDDGTASTTDTVGLVTLGSPNLTTREACAVGYQLVVAARTLEDETPAWQPPGEWNVDIDGSRTRFTYGMSFEVEGHDGSLGAQMEKFEYQPGGAGGEPRTTYLIATGTDVAFTADQARQIADELIRYAALLDATAKADER